ncbi:hypothetical protein BX600DRAFT_518096 [Xylariales sp. PMI_506]|nr:hypothetical protein BX600DRAFT_518096 [Xylariales sp. PMI_506]
MVSHFYILLSFLLSISIAYPVFSGPRTDLQPRLLKIDALGIDIDLSDLIPDGFLEGDSDTGGGGKTGETAGAVANGALSVGTTSGSEAKGTQGSTTSACSFFVCTSAAQATGKNGTSTQTSAGSFALLNGPILSIGSILKRCTQRIRLSL